MLPPSIHRNGTSREALVEAVSEAGRAVSAALRAVFEMAPNGRDYYVQGTDAILQAGREHRAMLAKLFGRPGRDLRPVGDDRARPARPRRRAGAGAAARRGARPRRRRACRAGTLLACSSATSTSAASAPPAWCKNKREREFDQAVLAALCEMLARSSCNGPISGFGILQMIRGEAP